MKTIRVILCLALCLALALPGLALAEADTVTITDHAGFEVTLPADIQRIAVCNILPLPSVLAAFFGSAERIVGMPATSMSAAKNGLLGELYPEILNAETGYIDGTTVNVEELMKLEPDVVFYSDTTPQLGEQLRGAGFNAVAISASKWGYDCIETLNQWIALLDQMFPGSDRAQAVAEYSQKSLDLVASRVADIPDEERARVFWLFQYSDSAIVTSGESFFGQWWLDSVGAVNVAKELQQDKAAETNLEQVYTWNPGVILITNFTPAQPSDLIGNTIGAYDWSGIDAVKTGRVYKTPLGLYRSYTAGADTPVTLLWLAKTLYPDLFEDIDIAQTAKEYYAEVFGVTLSDEQAASVFSPAADAATGF